MTQLRVMAPTSFLQWQFFKLCGKRQRNKLFTTHRRPSGAHMLYQIRNNSGFSRNFRFRLKSSDVHVAEQIFEACDYDLSFLARAAEIQARYEDILARGKRPLIIDAGANIGLASIYFRAMFCDAMIVSIEPDNGNIEQMRLHVGGDPNTIIVHGAVGPQMGHLYVYDGNHSDWSIRTSRSVIEGARKLGEVICYDLPSLMQMAGSNSEPFIAKIDIEGFETDLFADATEWIDAFPLLIIELHDWMLPGSASSSTFLKAIADRNRDFVFRGENVFSIANGVDAVI